MQGKIKEAIEIADKLLGKKNISFSELSSIPRVPGVYLIYDNDGRIIWVGRGKDIRRRIQADHISGEKKITTSSFRKKLAKDYKIRPGSEMRKMIIEKFSFAGIETLCGDQARLVEALMISYLRNRPEKAELLNDDWR